VQARFVPGIIVIITHIVIPTIDLTAVDTYKNTISQDISGTHLDVCCDVSNVGFYQLITVID